MLSIAHTYGAVSCNLKSASETSNAARSRAMVQKAFIDAFFHIFCVALVVAALAQSSCIDEARESVEKGHGKPIPGGYQVIENPKDDADVQAIAVATIDYYNEQSNDPRRFEIPDNGTVEAYRKVSVIVIYRLNFYSTANLAVTSLSWGPERSLGV